MEIESKMKRGEIGSIPYRAYAPERAKRILLFLHGADQRGDDNEAHIAETENSALAIERLLSSPYGAETEIYAPQCPKDSQWAGSSFEDILAGTYAFGEPTAPMSAVIALLNMFGQRGLPIYPVGISMGGFGVYDLLSRYPDRFARAAICCGGCDPSKLRAVRTPVLIFHGDRDDTVPLAASRAAAAALRNAGANVRLTVYPEVGHACWRQAFRDPEFFDRLFDEE